MRTYYYVFNILLLQYDVGAKNVMEANEPLFTTLGYYFYIHNHWHCCCMAVKFFFLQKKTVTSSQLLLSASPKGLAKCGTKTSNLLSIICRCLPLYLIPVVVVHYSMQRSEYCLS